MNLLAQLEQLRRNLAALGARRLAALGLIGALVIAVVGISGYYLSRPSSVPLYSNLDRDDVVGIGSALRDAGIPFDVNADDNTVMVPVAKASLARMTLAEKGLPHGGSDGYELFDKMGSLGLTSFMQEVTKVRALEGELARTIQMMQGVKAARVQIVMGDEGSFRREKQNPSASVVIRTDNSDDRMLGQAIRHLVSASLPGMTPDEVTVLDVNGLLLASGSDSIDQEPANMLSLEKQVAQDIQESIRRTLAPYLTLHNFQVSVATRLDTDKVQTSETTFDPDSRVERSVRVVRENQNTQNSSGQSPTSVTQNVPQQPSASDSKQSTDDTQKRDETTNYEISSKTVTRTSAGYSIKRLTVAVLVNRAAFVGADGKPMAQEAIQHQVDDIEQLVSSAAGLQKDRGDQVKVSVVDFADSGRELQPTPGPAFMDIVAQQSGTLIESLAVVVVAAMLIWFGIKPATKALLTAPATAESIAALDSSVFEPGAAMQTVLPDLGTDNLMLEAADAEPTNSVIEELLSRKEKSPHKFLEQLIDYDEAQAAAVLKQWMRKGANA